MSNIKIIKNFRRWLFGGIGFHNSEATMTSLMNEKFYNERVLKVFREISPTFSRVFAGYADWTRDAMDRFADYYDKTFRKSGTLIYLVPGRFPMYDDDFDVEDYCEKVAANLEYLIKERGCTKLRYYCMTNELSVGNTNCYLINHMDFFKKVHHSLKKAFIRYGLDIGLLAADSAGERLFGYLMRWVKENLDEDTEAYCHHFYIPINKIDSDLCYERMTEVFGYGVSMAHEKERRFIVGEFGVMPPEGKGYKGMPMRNDVCAAQFDPDDDGKCALYLAEVACAIINSGTFAGAQWTMFDYPDPFIREDGDTEKEKAIYDTVRFSGHGLTIRYNKHGMIKWCDDEKDYGARASLYTMGYMAKLFRKGSRTFETECDDIKLRCAAVSNADGSMSIVIINRADEEKTAELELQHKLEKPMRRYDFDSANIPYNKFCDLQPYSELIEAKDGKCELTVPAMSVTFLTTDYVDRKPSAIENIKCTDGKLTWNVCNDAEHCYYRVYADKKKDFVPTVENQICSTVAEYADVGNEKMYYKVLSVDKYGNI